MVRIALLRRMARRGRVLGILLIVALVATAAGTAATGGGAAGPCPNVPYQAPPAGAPPEPSVTCGPGLLGIGNIGVPLRSLPKTGPQPIVAPHVDVTARRLTGAVRRSVNASCYNSYGYAFLWAPTSAGSPTTVTSSGTSVGGLAVSSPGSSSAEHATGGMLSWQNSGSFWLQMGYVRGNISGPGTTWTDTLPSGYSEAYLEFTDTQGNYRFSPLQQVPYYEKHTFSITADASAHYYNFYLDGVLKWANVYLSTAPTIVLDGNEEYDTDGVCDSVYSDNNGFSPALGAQTRIHIDPGHTVGTAGSTGPWTSDGDTYVQQLAGLGYTCGQNSNGYYWWCPN